MRPLEKRIYRIEERKGFHPIQQEDGIRATLERHYEFLSKQNLKANLQKARNNKAV